MNTTNRKLIEDRLIIKATQKIKRHLTYKELSTFFIHNTHKSEALYQQYLEDLDKLIEKYLEGLK